MAPVLLVLLGLLTDVKAVRAVEWNPLAPMPEARFGVGSAMFGDRLLVLGGFGTAITGSVFAWDGTSWSSVAPMGVPRVHPRAAALGTQVFACGGFDATGKPLASVERYDGGSWSPVTPLPDDLGGVAIGAIGEAIYVAGGQRFTMQMTGACYRYDPVGNSWSPRAAMSTARSGAASVVFGGRLWVIGGFSPAPLSTVERYDPTSNTWSPGPTLPEPLAYAVAAVFDGRVWVMAGTDNGLQHSARVYSVGAGSSSWQQETALPAAISGPAAGVVGDCLVIAGGIGQGGLPQDAAFAACGPASPPPPPEPLAVGVSISPGTLGGSGQGPPIKVRITTDGWDSRRIDISSLRLDDVIPDLSAQTPPGIQDKEKSRLTVSFPRAPFASRPPGVYELELRGERDDGALLRGVGTIRVSGAANTLKVTRAADGRTSVTVSLETPEVVSLDVIDVQGRVVERLLTRTLLSGDHTWRWPRPGQAIGRGSLFVRLQRPRATDVVKLQVTRSS